MFIGETGEMLNLERLPEPSEAEAFEIDAPVGPTVTDPVSGEVSEFDSADVSWVGA